MEEPSVQNRRHPRYLADLEVIIYRQEDAIRAHIAQISRGGCLIFPPLPDPAASQLKMSFRLGEDLPYTNCKSAAKPDGKMMARSDFAEERNRRVEEQKKSQGSQETELIGRRLRKAGDSRS